MLINSIYGHIVFSFLKTKRCEDIGPLVLRSFSINKFLSDSLQCSYYMNSCRSQLIGKVVSFKYKLIPVFLFYFRLFILFKLIN